jgi:hypothetical protein
MISSGRIADSDEMHGDEPPEPSAAWQWPRSDGGDSFFSQPLGLTGRHAEAAVSPSLHSVEIVAEQFGGLIQQLTQALFEPADAAATVQAGTLQADAESGTVVGPAGNTVATVAPVTLNHAARKPTHFGTLLRVDDTAGSRFWIELSNDVDLASHPSEMTSRLVELDSLGAAFAIAKVRPASHPGSSAEKPPRKRTCCDAPQHRYYMEALRLFLSVFFVVNVMLFIVCW